MGKENDIEKAEAKAKAEVEEVFVNPIDEDKVAENPGLLRYAHNLGSAIIKPIDEGRTKGLAMSAMYEQTGSQLQQIREQVETLVRQARDIHTRITISEQIYQAEMRFEPVIMKTYHLYEKSDKTNVLSLIGPDEWGRTKPYTWIATVQLLSDHTWEVISSD